MILNKQRLTSISALHKQWVADIESNLRGWLFSVTSSTARKSNSVMIHSIVLAFILCSNLSVGKCGTIPSNNEPALLVVSFDGFRPEYLNGNNTPNLNKFREDGTSAQFMMNIFPTKTLVNHFTIATVSMIRFSKILTNSDEFFFCPILQGLYAENHGVLSNEFYDSNLKKSFKYSYEMFHYSNHTEPIWVSFCRNSFWFSLICWLILTGDKWNSYSGNEWKSW